MGFNFSAGEIFDIAKSLETNGTKFYRRMSEEVAAASIRKMLLEFAEMEEAHEKIFISMKNNLAEKDRQATVFDPQGETALYLQAMADIHVFDEDAKEGFILPEELSEEAKMRKILRAAIDLEWESIAFYLGMKEFVPENLGKKKIDDILKEEMRHVRLLSNRLISLKG